MTDRPEAIPLSTAARTDWRVRELVDDIKAGRAQFCAPCDAMHCTPTPEDLERLRQFISRAFT